MKKKIFLLFLVCLSFLFFSCDDSTNWKAFYNKLDWYYWQLYKRANIGHNHVESIIQIGETDE